MKTILLSKITALLLIIVLVLSACSKFEDGPLFSLISVKKRLSREWKVEFSRNLETGIEHSADFEGWLLSFEKNGSYSNSIIYDGVAIKYNGNWELIGQNQLRLDYTATSGRITEFYLILRLTKKELWLKNLSEEIHYYAD